MILGDVTSYEKFLINDKNVRLFGLTHIFKGSIDSHNRLENIENCPYKVNGFLSDYLDKKIEEYKNNDSILDIYSEDYFSTIEGSLYKNENLELDSQLDDADPLRKHTRKYYKCLYSNKDENLYSKCPFAKKSYDNSTAVRFHYTDVRTIDSPDNIFSNGRCLSAVDYFFENNSIFNSSFDQIISDQDVQQFNEQMRDENIRQEVKDFIRKMFNLFNFGDQFEISDYDDTSSILIKNYLLPYLNGIKNSLIFKRGYHKNFKQWEKLSNYPKVKNFIHRYFYQRLNKLLEFFDLEKKRKGDEIKFITFEIMLMDFYLLCRLLFRVFDDNKNSVIVVAGHTHTLNYSNFFKQMRREGNKNYDYLMSSVDLIYQSSINKEYNCSLVDDY